MAADAGGDHWSQIETPEQIARALRRLEQIADWPSEKQARSRALDLLGPRSGERVLDVGAGTGVLALDIARRVAPDGRVVAVDPSRALLDLAARGARVAGVADLLETVVADARKLSFEDALFDAAVCHWVLLHVSHPEHVVAEMRRVVRPQGRVMCIEVDWETATVHPGDKSLTRRILQASCDRHVDGWMGRRLLSLLCAAGLRDVQIEAIVNLERGEHPPFAEFLQSRVAFALEAGAVSQEEAKRWWSDLERARGSGAFFFSVTQFAVWGFS